MRNLILLIFEVKRNFRNQLFDSVEAQRNCVTGSSYQVKAQPNFRDQNFTRQCKYRIFCNLDRKGVNRHLIKKADIHQYYDRNGITLTEVESRKQGSRPRPNTQKKPEAKDRPSRGQGQECSRPRTGMLEAKDTGASVLQKKGLEIFFSSDLQFIMA